MTSVLASVLIAGLGNLFLGDDGFGIEVVRSLRHRYGGVLPHGVRVVDFGICGIDLYYALLDGVDFAILVDATHRDGPPGSLYVIEPSVEEATDGDDMPALMSPHDLQPANVLGALRRAGATVGRVVLVGCEPASFGTEDGEPGRIGLSDPVAAAVSRAIELIEALLAQTAAAPTDDLRLATPVSRSVS